jgi:hypothetical protein
MNIGHAIEAPTAVLIRSQSSRSRVPARIACTVTPERAARMRAAISCRPISSVKNSTGTPDRAAWVAMLQPATVLPTDGRAATITSCPGSSPPVISSKRVKPVASPARLPPRSLR